MKDHYSENSSNKKAALVIATLSAFITPFMGSSINIALPAIEKEFNVNAVLLAWIPMSYLLAAAVTLIPFGRLSDLYGRKKIFSVGIVIFTIASFFSAISISVFMLIFLRIIQGIGNSMIFASGMPILISVYPPHERGKVIGINVAAVYIGLSAGPLLGGFLTQHFSWRSIFILTIPFGVAVAYIAIRKLTGEWAEARGEKFDITGTFFYGIGIIGIMYGISLLPDLSSIWIIILGSAGISAFIIWETRVRYPVFQIRLFRNNISFAFSNLAALINYSATFAITFLLSLYLQHIKGLSPQGAGLILMFQPIVMALFSPFAGRLSDRVKPQIVASAGMFITFIGLLLFTFLNGSTSMTFIVLSLILLGFGFALFSSPNTNAIMSSVDKRFYGIASGTVGTMRLLGMMLSMGIATMIFSIFIGKVQITPEYYFVFVKSVRISFFIFCALCFLGFFASFISGKSKYPGSNGMDV